MFIFTIDKHLAMKLLLALLLTFAFDTLCAQKIIINGEEGTRPLTWSDFAGTPDNSNPFFAYTFWNLSYRFTGAHFTGDAAQLEGFEITLKFDPQASWVKPGKQTDGLLKHEQGHFNAGLLCLREAMNAVAAAHFTRSGYLDEVKTLVSNTVQKYKDMNLRYDEETAHSINKEAQARWNAFFEKELR